MDLLRERILKMVEEVADDPDKDARLKEIIVEAYMDLPAEERKAIIRSFAMQDEGNFDFLRKYVPKLYNEAFPIQ